MKINKRGEYMYEYLMRRYGECLIKARKQTDGNLRKFYENAAIGFKLKAQSLTLESA